MKGEQCYAKVGESSQQIGGVCPADFILMKTERPGNFYIANSSGDWVKDDVAEAKSARPDAIKKIKVDVEGIVFNGDEESQLKMTRAIVASIGDDELFSWELADNSVVDVTALQLKHALRMAWLEQERICSQRRK